MAASNEFMRDFFPGQRFLLTLTGSVLGAAAAKSAMSSRRLVTIRAVFKDGNVLKAKVTESHLTRYLPELVNYLTADRDRATS